MIDFTDKFGPADLIRINILIQLVGKNKKILDLGCSNGFVSKLIKDKGNDVYGVDISASLVKKTSRLGIKTFTADLENEIPFRKETFDVVVAGEVIEHIKDTDKFLQEIYRILKNDGYLVLTTSNFVSLGRRIQYLLGRAGYHEASLSYPNCSAGHLRYFNKELLLGLLKVNHFNVNLFTSDVVNFSFDTNSNIRSAFLAKTFPTLGRSLIVRASKSLLKK